MGHNQNPRNWRVARTIPAINGCGRLGNASHVSGWTTLKLAMGEPALIFIGHSPLRQAQRYALMARKKKKSSSLQGSQFQPSLLVGFDRASIGAVEAAGGFPRTPAARFDLPAPQGPLRGALGKEAARGGRHHAGRAAELDPLEPLLGVSQEPGLQAHTWFRPLGSSPKWPKRETKSWWLD